MGCAHMSRADVQALQDQSGRAFERAVEVFRTATPYGFAIRPHLRPYHVEGAQEMIDEGNHREAVFWISCLDTAYIVLENDAPDTEKPVFAAQFRAMQDALGFQSAKTWATRVDAAEHLAQEIYRITDALVALQPE